ncbi:MAG: aminopeptidase P family protein [Opitutales bacterium]|nr:aminopeptidase P family protein [Opitutales bacterium]
MEKLIYANTETSADMLYFAKMNIPDAVFAFTLRGKKCAILSPLEIGRARKESDFDKICAANGEPLETLLEIFSDLGINQVEVPRDFPAGIFLRLKNLGLKIKVCEGEFFPERGIKSAAEAAEIRKANDAASAAFERVFSIFKESKIEKNFLKWRGNFLTSEILKFEIESACLARGADSKYTIAACGDQACDPHCEGFGKISANKLCVFDIFPRLKSSGYFGDMTRTFLKGEPSGAQIKLVETVQKAQKKAMQKIRAGARANAAHNAVLSFFEKNGYKTEFDGKSWSGFFHSTGHGLGLEVHEEPRLGRAKNILKEGEVVTVEPGLYYKGVGGCRIEDNVLVRQNGFDLLSNFHYEWVVK